MWCEYRYVCENCLYEKRRQKRGENINFELFSLSGAVLDGRMCGWVNLACFLEENLRDIIFNIHSLLDKITEPNASIINYIRFYHVFLNNLRSDPKTLASRQQSNYSYQFKLNDKNQKLSLCLLSFTNTKWMRKSERVKLWQRTRRYLKGVEFWVFCMRCLSCFIYEFHQHGQLLLVL